jgi:large subunit ribosomal protein L7/L12
MAKLSKDEILSAVEEMTVLELADLVKALEEKFGVSAAPVAVAAAPAAGAAAEVKEEQTVFNVVLTEAGAQKLAVIKTVRELVPTLGLQEAKTLVESAPKEVLTGLNKSAAEEAKKKLEAAGAKVELK